MARVSPRSRRTVCSGETIGRSCSLRTTPVLGGFANNSPDRGEFAYQLAPRIPRREPPAIGPSEPARIAGIAGNAASRLFAGAVDFRRP